jgi:hypothetical protein
MPVTLATLEAELEKTLVQDQSGQKTFVRSHAHVCACHPKLQGTLIWGGLQLKKKFVRSNISGKNLGMVAHTYDSSNSKKYKIGRLWSRLA